MKKTILAWLLVLALMLGGVACAEGMEVTPITVLDTQEVVIDPANPLGSQYYGMYSIELPMEDGTVRTLYQYVPTSWTYRQPEVAIGVPAGEDPFAFFEATGWKALMDEQGFAALLMVAGEGGWQADESEYAYAAFAYMDDRTYLQTQDSAFYMVGYGDAANAVMAHAVTNSEKFAGFAAFGVDTFDVAVLEEGRTTESAEPGVMKSAVKVPMWIGAQEKTAATEELIAYWKDANDVDYPAQRNAYADEIYARPIYMLLDNAVTDQNVATVRVTLDLSSVATPAFTDELWNNFLRRVRRQDSGNINALRAFATNLELGMDYHSMEVEGTTREFYVYVPTAVKSGKLENVPVLFVCHGGGGSGEEFANRSGWHRTAEEREFIAVFLTGSRGGTGIKAGTSWRESDYPFFEAARAYVLENYSADESRVYIFGHSAGSSLVNYITYSHPEMIAAAAINGAHTEPQVAENLVEDVVMPIILNAGTLDYGYTEGGRNFEKAPYYMAGWSVRYGNEKTPEETFAFEDGRYFGSVWTNKDGIPVLRLQWVRDMTHAVIPEATYEMYDFLSNYSRGEDGACYYQGVLVELK